MYQSLTVLQLKKKCKELKLKGYSKLKRAELVKMLVDHEKSVHDAQTNKKDEETKIVEIKPLSKEKLQQISEYFKNPPTTKQFCKHKSRYEMKKLLLKTKYQILLSYYHFRNPNQRHDTKSSEILYSNVQYNIPEFLTYGAGQEQFYPLDSKHFVTINDFIDEEWFVQQNQFIKSLTSFQRAFLFAYSNNSFDTITPFLIESTKAKPNYDASFEKYKSWMKGATKDWVHPIQLALIIVSKHKNLKNNFPKTQKANTLFENIKNGEFFTTPAIKQMIREYVKVKQVEILMSWCGRGLGWGVANAPSIKKPFYLFRTESNFRYRDLLKENKTSVKNCTFTSTSNDEQYILDRTGKEYIRFHLCPGTKVLFIRGCSYFKKENEFLLAPSHFDNIRENSFRTSGDICCPKNTKIYDVDVKPL